MHARLRSFATLLATALFVSRAVAVALEPPAPTLHARAYQPGELVVLTVPTNAAASDVRVRAFGHDIPAFREGKDACVALIGIDLDVLPGKQTVTIDLPDGKHLVQTFAVARHRFPTRKLQVDPDFVTPPPSVQERIEREARELAAIWKTSAADRLWTEAFVRPVPGDANSSFGTRSVFNGQARSPHGGADFPSPTGTPIHAPGGGRIVLARDLYFTGNTVVIDHGLGMFSTLAHLSAFETREGERVEAGQIVGRVGATGRVTGPHLHWAVRIGGARVDPLSVLALLH
jgi:murein DD-endopeptidase MepM/ murein hydrolase activator NlpD